ncbi:flagellar hook-associated protein FlgK [Simiduia curdlanivorans]|uniref:Flagellar hook-associated protein 1 n=1 Tax=Simiduia curdlanivorans TaxID=1492769 RepID=A0ABV8V1X3_9GAMM|nr:flagellar hook-associated protein FlgK [Simiduia curdlanivorans]MDN3639954.1 flagellar hook-associated protein FlgK [Simiduia curdlanivorans]
MADLLGISISGLKFSQSALKTTSHNITNADTAGFSRQRALAVTNPATLLGGNYAGNGVSLDSIERIASQFAIDQLRSDTTLYSELDTFNDSIQQVDSLLSDPSTGIAAGLQTFFAAVQNGANDPTSIPSRQLIVSEASNLATRFNTLYDRFNALNNGITQQLDTAIAQINSLTSVIAELNGKISLAFGAGQGAEPNDLLDQRDEALRQLATFVSVSTFDQGDNQINVLVGNGQPLVVGATSRNLRIEDGLLDASKSDIVFDSNNGPQRITDLISGGSVGGLLKFRDQILDPAINEIGRLAIVLGESFNEIHTQGLDLNGDFGADFFSDANDPLVAASRVKASSGNLPPDDRRLMLNIVDVSSLTASDYEMKMGPSGTYTITKLSDDSIAAKGIMATSFPFEVEFDGLSLEFSGGSFTNGDRFLLQPTRLGARSIDAQITRTEEIAFASPVVTDSSLANQGNGAISAGEVLSTTDANGNLLPLFSDAGKFSPPLIVKFTTPTSYDILDNSDPGNPVQLDPPIRNQRFVPGLSNPLFSEDPGSTLVSSNGRAIGLPSGSSPLLQASLQPTGAVAPNYGVFDFSATTNQFSFDVVVSNTLNGVNDGTFVVTINSPSILDDASLLADINDDLAASNVVAYIDQNGELAFRMRSLGYGDVSLQNYNGDPDGNADFAPAGQANNLLGFNVEGAAFTTAGGASGVSGQGVVGNRYPSEIIRINSVSPSTGLPVTTSLTTTQNGSARLLASSLSNIAGVTATAHTHVKIDNLNLTRVEPLQLTLNGENLLEYVIDPNTGASVLANNIPDPATDQPAFINYLNDRIGANSSLSAVGVYASVYVDASTGRTSLSVTSSLGDDLDFRLTAAAGNTVDVGDGVNSQMRLTANGPGVQSGVVVGGRVDVTLAEGYTMTTLPTVSQLFGNSGAANFQQSKYVGIQASIDGHPVTGDVFTLDFNLDASADNRNALNMVDLELERIVDGGKNTFSSAYGKVVEEVGTKTASSKINRDAAEKILSQSQTLRDSISGVNLEEEAANLIRFEQLYNANAQAISVARDLFDRLLSSF